MKLHVCLLCFLFLVMIGSTSAFDYFYLVLQWGPSTCTAQGSKPCLGTVKTDNFTVHGLWPQVKGKTSHQPRLCSTVAFDLKQVTSLQSRLRESWPDVYRQPPSTEFWEQQWLKHGTCATGFTQYSYFEAAVILKENLNLFNRLKTDGGFKPGTQVDPRGMKAFIRDEITKELPQISCNKSAQEQIWEIYFCIATDGKTYIACPDPIDSKVTCKNNAVHFP